MASGVAHAGDGGCAYGKHMAKLKEQAVLAAAAEELEAKRLAALEEQQASLIEQPALPLTFN